MGSATDGVSGEVPQIPGMWPYDADITGEGPSTPRIRAISAVVAAEVSKRDIVRGFREKYLGDRLLSAGEVDAWVQEHIEQRQRPARWLYNIPFEPGYQVQDGSYVVPATIMRQALGNDPDSAESRDGWDGSEAPSARTRELVYATPHDKHATATITKVGGVLDTLRTLAHGLIEVQFFKRWEEEHAATFILTGYTPLVSPKDYPLPARSGRRQTDKHLQLAAFTALREAAGKSLAARMAEWNTRYPHWAYKNTTNFGWDSRQAERRLMQYAAAIKELDEIVARQRE